MSARFSISDITHKIENFWLIELSSKDGNKGNKEENENKKNLTNRINAHLTQFLLHCRDPSSSSFFSSTSLQADYLLALRAWSQLTKVCRDLNNAQTLLIEEEICAGTVIDYLGNFSKMLSPFLAAPFHTEPPLKSDEKVEFYPFCLTEAKIEIQTKKQRFLQAAYKMAYSFKEVHSLEFISFKILNKIGLRLVRRIPSYEQPDKISFNITDLVPQLKLLVSQQGDGYLLGIGNGTVAHAFAIYLKKPFHFIDPAYGIAIAQDFEALLLFLANYLTEKYFNYHSFALLEFAFDQPKS